LVERLSNGTTGRLPTGVVDLRSPESLEAAKADAVRELDSLPAPSRAHLPFGEYLAHSPRNLHAGRIASIVTSRGCPFRCDFCSVHSVCGYKWRPRSPAHVLAEIDELTGRWGVDVLEIEDDNFTLQRERALEILAGIEERNAGGRNIGWMAPNGLRIDTLDNELLAAMARSGCLGINLALEHGDPDVLKAMNKRLDRDKALIVAALVHRYRIPCGVFLIVGYPGETKERFENGLAFYRRLKAVAPSLEFKPFFAQPYPGTALLRNAVAEGLLPSDAFQTPESLRRLSTSQSIWLETSDFDAREVRRRRDRILWTVDPSRFLVMKALDRLPPAATNVARTVLQGARAVRRRLREPAPSGRRNSDRQ
jgi:magnesium-protoporphyrin IX monomethyl ester (oxidative) cyclase